MPELPYVSVVIVTLNRKDQLLRLLATVASSDYPQERLEILVVDNVSTDGTIEAVRTSFPQAHIHSQTKNLYSAGGRNVGARAATGDYVFFVDDDNILDHGCIRALVAAMESDLKLGIAAPLMLHYPNEDIIWCAGGRLNKFGLPGHVHGGERLGGVKLPEKITDVDYFPNAYMIRSELLRRGVFHDDDNFPHNWNEQDLCIRARQAGYGLATVTSAVTSHDIGYSSFLTRVSPDKTFDQARARLLYRRKYMNSLRQWLPFWTVIFPASTVIYLKAFARDPDHGFASLLFSYLKGTLAGLTKRL